MKKVFISSFFIIIGFIFGLGVSVLAWVNPSQSPPLGGGVLQTDTSGLKIVTTTQITTGNFTVNNGNVGIGTTVPEDKLAVAGHIRFGTGATRSQLFADATNAVWSLPSTTGLFDFKKSDGTVLATIASDRVTFMSGNVGIGTTGPIHKLEVNSSADWLTAKFDSPGPWTAIKMRAGNTLVNTLGLYMHYGGTGAGDNNQFRLGRANPNDPNMGWFGANPVIFDLDAPDSTFVVQGDGNVGIGTYSPWSKLSIEQSGGNSGVGIHRPGVSAGGVAAGLQNTAGISVFSNWWGGFSGEPIRFGWAPWNGDWNNFTEVMRINTNGNVGIGTTTPAEKLTVAGNIDVTGNRIVNLASPINSTDAATKGYVDAQAGGGWKYCYGKCVGSNTPVQCAPGETKIADWGYGTGCASEVRIIYGNGLRFATLYFSSFTEEAVVSSYYHPNEGQTWLSRILCYHYGGDYPAGPYASGCSICCY